MRRVAVLKAAVGAGLLLCAVPATAGQLRGAEPIVPEKVGKDLHAHHIVGRPPRIDGSLDDETWSLAPAADDFVQNEPDNMKPPRDRTVMQFAYDDRTLYVAIQCFVENNPTITTGLGRRDNLPPSDLLRLSFDPRHDHQTAYVFETNPSGMQSDYLFYDDTRQSPDYDAVWEVRTTVADDRWIAEYAIPLSQMRFTVSPDDRTVWGLNLRRDVHHTGEFDRWVATPRGAAGFVSRFGHLIFDSRLAPPRRLEIMPVVLGRVEDSATTALDQSVAAGVDLRVGLGTATTLSATLNPDFAQVEQDPSVLNLSVFETFYPEKRPFFVEDSRTFVPPYNQMIMFHSRRIGRNPSRLTLPDTLTEISRPDQTTIFGAAKVTGKSGPWAYGGISAATAAEYAIVESTATDAAGRERVTRSERLVEPQTSYNVGRVQRDLRAGTSNIGGIVTATLRDGDLDAYTAASDYTFRWDESRGSFNGQWAGTYAPITGSMRDGFGGVTNVNYGRKHFAVNGHYDYFSSDFRISDLGFFQSRPNKTSINGGFNVNQPDPVGPFRSIGTWHYLNRSWNTDGVVFEKRIGEGIDVTFKNFWGGYVEYGRDFQRLDDLDTRGGPPIVKPALWNVWTGGRTDSRKTWQISLNANIQNDSEGGSGIRLSPNLRFRPQPQLQLNVSGSYESGTDAAQWIKNVDVTGDDVKEHVYGHLQRDVVSLTFRGTYAFTRDMTLEAYLQPFVAVGDYTDIRRLARPSSYEFEPATLTTDPDFNTKSMRGNIVFRWEYVKGSTFFFVWNLSAVDETRPGLFSPFRDLGDSFSGAGTNVFMVKMNYWLGL